MNQNTKFKFNRALCTVDVRFCRAAAMQLSVVDCTWLILWFGSSQRWSAPTRSFALNLLPPWIHGRCTTPNHWHLLGACNTNCSTFPFPRSTSTVSHRGSLNTLLYPLHQTEIPSVSPKWHRLFWYDTADQLVCIRFANCGVLHSHGFLLTTVIPSHQVERRFRDYQSREFVYDCTMWNAPLLSLAPELIQTIGNQASGNGYAKLLTRA